MGPALEKAGREKDILIQLTSQAIAKSMGAIGARMSFDEDKVELTGSRLDQIIYRMVQARSSGFIVKDQQGKWNSAVSHPPAGNGEYYAVMQNGEVRKYFNASEPDKYELIQASSRK